MKFFKPTIRLLIGLSLAYAWMYTGFKVGEGMRLQAEAQVEVAKYNEIAARHRAIQAQYNSTKWTLVVNEVNGRLLKVCAKLPKKNRKDICPVGS
jgi:hypothetical protein